MNEDSLQIEETEMQEHQIDETQNQEIEAVETENEETQIEETETQTISVSIDNVSMSDSVESLSVTGVLLCVFILFFGFFMIDSRG